MTSLASLASTNAVATVPSRAVYTTLPRAVPVLYRRCARAVPVLCPCCARAVPRGLHHAARHAD